MSSALAIAVGLLSGAAIGALYFAWLWRSVRALGVRGRPGARIAAGLLGRLAFALLCFGALARWGGGPALAGALAGFVALRVTLVRRVRAIEREDEPR